MNFHEHLSHWESFYLLVGTAGATLAGLTFVAVTAAERVVRERNNVTPLRTHIDPALLAFTLTLVLGCVLLMPTLTPLVLSLVLLGTGVYFLGYSLFTMRQFDWSSVAKYYDRLDWLFFVVMPLASGLSLVVAGWLCSRGHTELALTVTGVALLALLLMGIRNALDMLMATLNYAAKSAQETQPPTDQH